MSEEYEGIVEGHRSGHGFVVRAGDDPDIFLPPPEMRTVLHGDRVRVRVVRQDRRGRPEGHVLEVLERRVHTIIGKLLREDSAWLVAPEDRRYGQDVLVPDGATRSAKPGQIVVVELEQPPALVGQLVGRVVEVLGDVDDAGIEIEIAVREYGVPHEFSEACKKESGALPTKVRVRDKSGRVDLTDVPFVTIDGADARDFDDAVYCEPAEKSRWRLLVAIADVSHYVKDGRAIDVDAYERATSVYFPRRVIPMLPEKLSNGLCSLNPDEERLALVCDMVVTDEGDVAAYQFYPAVIRSSARLVYDEVAAILTNTRGPEAAARQERIEDLRHLQGAYLSLLQARERRGAVDFDLPETEIVCDEWGKIAAIERRERTQAHRIIEECMLAANVCAAGFIQQAKHSGLYRVHEPPADDKVEVLRAYLQALGLGAKLSDPPKPRDYQRISEAAHDRPDAQQVQMMLLRSMNQAVYAPENRGHFGLAYPAYTHFTSPIRRYPDLLTHRVIKAILADKVYRLRKLPPAGEAEERFGRVPRQHVADRADDGKRRRKPSVDAQRWAAAGLHCSACERRADEASRDVESWLKCEYMRAHLGEEYDGTVSAVTRFGMFVTLDAIYIDGLVFIAELGDDYFHFDEVRQELRGEHSGMRYRLGTHVRVQVSRVNLDARQIDFRLLHDRSSAPRPPATTPKKAPRSPQRAALVQPGKGGASSAKQESRQPAHSHRGGKTAGKKARKPEVKSKSARSRR